MRTIGRTGTWTACGLGGMFVLGFASAGCFSLGSDCHNTLSCEVGTAGAGGQSGTGGGGGDGGDGGGSTTSTIVEPAHCGDDPAKPDAVANDCGVFVNGAAPVGGDGTRQNPVATFTEAAKLLDTSSIPRRIFACAGPVAEKATVTLTGTQVLGGFSECAGDLWTWDGTERTAWNGPKNQVALRFTGGESSVSHVDITSPVPDEAGASSIAVVVNGEGGATTLALSSVKLETGDAAAGKAGDAWLADPLLAGLDGFPGIDACGPGPTHSGGTAAMTAVCPDGAKSVSGKGGDGSSSAAQNGGDGANGSPGRPPPGKGGKGQTATLCENGNLGADGAVGMSGAGAKGDGLLSAAGYTGAAGANGAAGQSGQGGGGGGGSKGASGVTCGAATNLSVAGASGGSGGTGGCGGRGGNGGRAGGSSIALIVLGAVVTFEAVHLVVNEGGAGGKGGAGQAGGVRGLGKLGGAAAGIASAACAGGHGGFGGAGGPGGGGRGGHAIGIAYTGMEPALTGLTFMLPTSLQAAPGGLGGTGSDASSIGAAGLVAETHGF